jgi:probable HAF family extracellular repeat protein/T5SS/PEP-CTERM-associated repeat protein
MKRLVLSILLTALLALPGAALLAPSAGGPASAQAAPSSQARYTITDLGTLGGTTTKGYGINEEGQVVGASQVGTTMHAFLWDDGTMTNLGALGGQGSWAYDANDAGQVVGGSPLASGNNHAFRWQNGSMQDLGTLGGTTSYAFAINNSGQAVGSACCAPDTYLSHAVLWGSAGIVDLGDLDPLWPAISAAYGLNDAGQVVGGSYDASANFHAFLWQNGAMQDMGTLGGDYSSAQAINENGQVVGVARLANGKPHAFMWDGGMQDLGALTWDQSIAYGINDKGQVVGALQTGPTSHAFVWANGQMQDLNTLIPANSGWVLQEARAINNKGRIVGFGVTNGQTRAVLLVPRAYHWINPSGGSWHVTTNWDPQGDPGDGDTVIFGLSGQYAVDASALAAAAAPTVNFPVGRAIISGTNTVEFVHLALNLLDDSVDEPALTVSDGGTVKITSGTGNLIHALIGGAPPANPANPPLARLQVLGNGTSLNGTGRLSIGDEGAGELFVTAGGHLTSAEARIGGLLATGTGVADVGGDGSLWDTGNIAVGYGVSGTLSIQYGGRVNSNDAYVSWGALSEDSNVIVNSLSANTSQPAMWALLGSLTVGQTWFGSVEVLDGGDLYVSQDVHIKNGEINIEGRHANGDPSDLDVLGSVFVGGAGSANLLALRNAAKGDIEGDLIIGKDGPGAAILWGSAVTSDPTWLNVVDPAAGLCVIGWVHDGGVSLDDGGLFRCRNIQLGQAGTSGAGYLTVDGGMVRALDVLTVGQVGGGSGVVDMENNALVATNGTYITPNGVISGTGTLAVGFLGLHNDGTLAPGITVLYPHAGAGSFPASTGPQDGAATMAITGTLTIGPTGRLEVPVAGRSAGRYGRLAVTGAATLDGVLALNFTQGYAPRRTDTFTFLTATGGVSGTFDSVEISGLAPGFQYRLTYTNGQLALEALNDGVPISGPPRRTVFLPLVVR